MFGESGGLGRAKKTEEADLDITPMIDVTFLLLIFFMVTSTMQGTPDKDIPPAAMGDNVNAAGFFEITIRAPKSAGTEGEIQLKDTPVNLEQLKAEMIKDASVKPIKIMIYAERDVKSGRVGEVEAIIGEVATETETEIEMKFAVTDRK